MGTKVIRITSARPGFMRGGHAHPAAPTDYAPGFFSDAQLAAICAEPMLTVEEVEVDGDAPVILPKSSERPLGEDEIAELIDGLRADHEAELDALREKAEADKNTALAALRQELEAIGQAVVDELRKQAEIDKEAAVAEALKATAEKEPSGKAKPAAGRR